MNEIEALKEKLERKERSQMISEEVFEALRKEYEDVRSENMQLREALIGLQSRLVEYISKYNRLKHAMTDADNLLADALAYEDAIEAQLKEEDKPCE